MYVCVCRVYACTHACVYRSVSSQRCTCYSDMYNSLRHGREDMVFVCVFNDASRKTEVSSVEGLNVPFLSAFSLNFGLPINTAHMSADVNICVTVLLRVCTSV
jgi:hypothetical protein